MNYGYICFFAAAIPAVADIDSGGGSAAVGSMTNYASIGSPFATGNSAVGTNENKSGLIQVLFTGNAATNTDANTNGLPDQWENQYFPGQTLNPLADADGDGTSNLMEYVAGTNPTDRSSKLQPTGTHNGSVYTMPIQTVAGRNYKVWVTKDLSSWTLQQSYTGDGTQKVFTFDETTMPAGPLHASRHPSAYFFRIEVVLP
ncbi:MAG: hypothetical protein ORN51_14360 [Akkermansiaceae bacterium]|nr:hypothetical protein [Akkermansiaceae bacterium]